MHVLKPRKRIIALSFCTLKPRKRVFTHTRAVQIYAKITYILTVTTGFFVGNQKKDRIGVFWVIKNFILVVFLMRYDQVKMMIFFLDWCNFHSAELFFIFMPMEKVNRWY
jgi:hypothetical protein